MLYHITGSLHGRSKLEAVLVRGEYYPATVASINPKRKKAPVKVRGPNIEKKRLPSLPVSRSPSSGPLHCLRGGGRCLGVRGYAEVQGAWVPGCLALLKRSTVPRAVSVFLPQALPKDKAAKPAKATEKKTAPKDKALERAFIEQAFTRLWQNELLFCSAQGKAKAAPKPKPMDYSAVKHLVRLEVDSPSHDT